jgi:hypothetical protein
MSIKVKGHRVLLNRPVKEKRLIKLSPEMEEAMEFEELKKLKNLEVFAVGEEVQGINVGDKVYVQLMSLQSAELVEVEGNEKIMVRSSDIAIIW